MSRPIDKITLKGFKSIRSLEDFELGPVNVLIGANGSGKTNFVSTGPVPVERSRLISYH
jgi:predicted ATPase